MLTAKQQKEAAKSMGSGVRQSCGQTGQRVQSHGALGESQTFPKSLSPSVSLNEVNVCAQCY
jgi:hypothetical protein